MKLFFFFLLISLGASAQHSGYVKSNLRMQYPTVGIDSTLHIPAYNGTPSGLRSGSWTGSGQIAIDTTNHIVYFRSGGSWRTVGTGSSNSNVGSAYRLAIPNTNNIKTLSNGYGIIYDSATSNQIGAKVDTATLFPVIRNTSRKFAKEDNRSAEDRYFSMRSTNFFTMDSVGEFQIYGYGSNQTTFEQSTNQIYMQTMRVSDGDYVSQTLSPGVFHVLGSWDYLGGSDGDIFLKEESGHLEAGVQLYPNGNGAYGEIQLYSGTADTSMQVSLKSEKLHTYYSNIDMGNTGSIDLKTKKMPGNTYKGMKIDLNHQIFVDSMATGGVAADSVVVITSGGQLKKRDAASFGGGGSGTVDSGLQYELAYYPSNGTTVDGNSMIGTNANGRLIVSNSDAEVFSASTTNSSGISGSGFYAVGRFYAPNMTSSQVAQYFVGKTSNTNDAYSIDFVYSGVSSTNNRMDLGFYGNNGLIQLKASGAIRFLNYGTGSMTGTPAYYLAVDASGNVIEDAPIPAPLALQRQLNDALTTIADQQRQIDELKTLVQAIAKPNN